MSLVTDGAISTIEELGAYESSILDVAVTEGIDLTVKLTLASEELGIDLEAWLAEQGGAGLENVVVTEPLHKWHTFRALALVFRDAYHRQLNDRYLAKWREYQRLAQWAQDALHQTGLGLVREPVVRAAAPELSSVTGGALAAAVYYVRAAWRNAAGVEGAPSEVAVLSVPAGELLVAAAAEAPANAASWSVYVGAAATDLKRQDVGPLPVGVEWMEPVTGLEEGAAPGSGQAPDYTLRPSRVFLRG